MSKPITPEQWKKEFKQIWGVEPTQQIEEFVDQQIALAKQQSREEVIEEIKGCRAKPSENSDYWAFIEGWNGASDSVLDSLSQPLKEPAIGSSKCMKCGGQLFNTIIHQCPSNQDSKGESK